jgi:hypothetical protein
MAFADVRPPLPSSRRRAGADPASAGACLRPDDGAVPRMQAAPTRPDWDRVERFLTGVTPTGRIGGTSLLFRDYCCLVGDKLPSDLRDG